MPDGPTVTSERLLPVPPKEAYAWLTDYDDGDGQRAGAVISKRQVLQRTEDRVELEEEVDVLGLQRTVRTVVDLQAPGRWQATLHEDGEPGDVYTYRLAEGPDPGTRQLTVTYTYAVDSRPQAWLLGLIRPLIRRKIAQMWDGFIEAMVAELDTDGQQASS